MPARFPAGRALRLLAASLVVTGVLAGPGSAGASGSTCQNWTGAPPPNPGTFANVLNGVAVVSACDAWAVGYDAGTGADQTLIEHWNGSAWTVVASPDPGAGDNLLSSVQAASRTDIWAVGSYADTFGHIKALALHWNGTVWKQVATPNPGAATNELSGVRVRSTNAAWAVGDTGNDPHLLQTLILHWNGTRWTRVASPNPGTGAGGLSGVAATSASNAWAVGSTGAGTLILHWNGTKWTHVASPSPGMNAGLGGVSAASAANAWAVGAFYNGSLQRTLILHWNGARWRRVTSPNPGGSAHDNVLSGVAVTSAGNAWAVGSYTSGPAFRGKTLILRWNGTNWTQVASPDPGTSNQLNAVRAWSASNAWAVGSFSNGGPSQALAIHCC
jgi:hypothetical protein